MRPLTSTIKNSLGLTRPKTDLKVYKTTGGLVDSAKVLIRSNREFYSQELATTRLPTPKVFIQSSPLPGAGSLYDI